MKYVLASLVFFSGLIAVGATTDVYRLSMTLKVPRTYDNMESKGYRKYQSQNIIGELMIRYDGDEPPVVTITNLVNKTHKIGGKFITYGTTVDESLVLTRVNLIGSNKKNTFRSPSVVFYIDAEPSYNVGEDDEDNSLLGVMSGNGTTVKVCKYRYECVCGCLKRVKVDEYRRINSLRGNFAGTLGCGCKAYGHVSPTRIAGPRGATDTVDDVAATFGTWSARFVKRLKDE